MKLFVPKNIYSSLFLSSLNNSSGIEIIGNDSALLTKQLETDTAAVALIPSLELIKNQTLFVSSKIGMSFDGILSNAYLSFSGLQKDISKIKIRGDVSVNEIILAKILFSERYSANVELHLDPAKEKSGNDNYLVVGDENFHSGGFLTGISFADQIAELIDLPYVNYVFVSKDKDSLGNLNSIVSEIDIKIEDNLSDILSKLNYSEETKSFIKDNIGTVYYEIIQNEIDALNELIKLTYYHGIIDDIFDLKFI